MPADLWDDEDDAGAEADPGVVGVRGEKALEWDEEVQLADENVATHKNVYGMSVDGMRDVLARVWRKLEKANSVVQRTTKNAAEKTRKLDDGHDADL